jgi:hypothetical protein
MMAIKKLIVCVFCGFKYPQELGRYGCPNCLGDGLKTMMLKIVEKE